MTDRSEIRARVGWALVTEPNDHVAGALLATIGATEAWALLEEGRTAPFRLGLPRMVEAVMETGVGEPLALKAHARWSRRALEAAPDETIRKSKLLGATIITPASDWWPEGINDLGAGAPHCLWVRGAQDALLEVFQGAALVGSRACTGYGEHVTATLVQALCAAGRTVVSGGAYGIDAVAHRTAVALGGTTVAVSAGGVDRYYPAGNANLLRSIAEGSGAVCSELPPGALPMKSRFLSRNRLIAALSGATVVVEAAWRSGALSTAQHALELGRPVGAVPGPVTSAQSAGSHRLLRSNLVSLVSTGNEVIELLGDFEIAQTKAAVEGSATQRSQPTVDPAALRVLDGMSHRRPLHEELISVNSGLMPSETLQILGSLEMQGLVAREPQGWRMVI